MSKMKNGLKRQHIFSPMLRRLFDIREGEFHRTAWMFLYLLLLIMGLMIVKPVSTALFLDQFSGRHLPFAYILTAVLAATLSAGYSRLLKTKALQSLMLSTLAAAICFLGLFWTFIHFQLARGVVLYLFFVWCSLATLICSSQFWLAAGLFFNVREAKRLFGPIGAGAIIGGIAGGYLTRFLAPVIGSCNLILAAVLCLAACMAILGKLWENYGSATVSTEYGRAESDSTGAWLSLSQVLKSRHLLLTALILAVSVITSRLVDYQFNVIVSGLIPDKDNLAAFLGMWMSNLNLVSLGIQLVFTRKILEIFGVSHSLLFMPAAVLFGAAATLFSPALWSAVLVKVSEGSFKNSLNKSGMELMFLPIPLKIKHRAKAFIDIFVDSAAGGMGGLLLAGLVFGLNIAPRDISFVILAFVLVWVLLILRIKREYIRYFIEKLDRGSDDLDIPAGAIPDNDKVIQGISLLLAGKNASETLSLMRRISGFHSEKLAPSFIGLLDHPDPEICAEALRKLYFLKKVDVREKAGMLMRSSDDLTVRAEAVRYLFYFDANPGAFLETLLADDDHWVRGAAMLCLVREARKNRQLRAGFNPEKMIEGLIFEAGNIEDSRQASFHRKICARAISLADIAALHPYLFLLMEDKDPDVVIEAITGAGQTRDPMFIRVILSFLGRRSLYRKAAVQALISYGTGILETLEQGLSNPYLSYTIRKQIPEVLAVFRDQKAVDILAAHLMQKDIGLRYEVIRALNRLRLKSDSLLFDKKKILSKIKTEADNYMDMLHILYGQIGLEGKDVEPDRDRARAREQLIRVLEIRLDESLERIFRLLGLRYPPLDMYNAYKGIRSTDPDVRVSAMEFLDNILEINVKQIIIPVIETGSAPRQGLVESEVKDIPDEFEAHVALLQGEDDVLKVKTLNLLLYHPDDRYLPFMAELISSPSSSVRTMARRAVTRTGRFRF